MFSSSPGRTSLTQSSHNKCGKGFARSTQQVILTMAPPGIMVFFFSIWIMMTTMLDVFVSSQGIATSDCRIAGITLIEQKHGFTFSQAQKECRDLGLTLAGRFQVEKARQHGFETCRFGWVAEGFIVISRITPNEKCAQNKTGVAIWRVDHNKKHLGYCYNSSDTWINSCIPEASTTALPNSSTEVNSTSAVSVLDTSATRTSQSPQTKKLWKLFKVICVTEIITTEPTTPTTWEKITNGAVFRHTNSGFGGVPTALLVLALIFFVASVVLAVCYIKKYKKTFPVSHERKKERIETKDTKEAKTSGKTSEQELKKNGKKAEPQARSEPPVKCLEAEV